MCMSSISDRLPASKKDLKDLELRLEKFITEVIAGESSLEILREELKKAEEALNKAVQQNQP